MKRGDLYWARLAPRSDGEDRLPPERCPSGSEQKGRRPVIVVSHDGFNEVPAWRSVIVVPVTTSVRQAARGPTVVELPASSSALPKDSFALCHQVTTLDRSKLEARVGQLGSEVMDRVAAGIIAACDLKRA